MRRTLLAPLCLTAAALAAAPLLLAQPHEHHPAAPAHAPKPAAQAADLDHACPVCTHPLAAVTDAVAVIMPTADHQVRGLIRFHQNPDGKVHITGAVTGLNPNQQHAIHVHEFGDASAPDATSAGSHYNPQGHPHGLPHTHGPRHAGDFGNLQADDQGKATLDLTVDNLSLGGAANPILGRALIIHAQPDDGGQPVGNAGDRIAVGIIGIAKPIKN